jgi:hypothetical protein
MLGNEEARREDEIIRFRVEFAQSAFDSIQQLIRFVDQKSSLVLGVTGLFSTALFVIIDSRGGWSASTKYVVGSLVLWYVVHAALTMWHAILTFKARPHTLGNRCGAPAMLFPLMILSRYNESDYQYLQALRELESQDILADYAQQVMEISHIYRVKQSHLQRASRQLLWSAVPWFILTATSIVTELVPIPSAVGIYGLPVLIIVLAVLGSVAVAKA